ncbi:replicative DNA helicase [Nocardiopsis sp. HNM0947]|uniref:Replicative DNA helicase n=1 Tax=Nocardiopsis coralli TaxID=2772213 RepID=A0ABR9P2R6_9ACTN|nr:replicative DNA helicase [Nocardiopsis coralli]MBE2998146.1 replicative DNA helicase [Nocardiopsis coralli]
MSVAEEPPEERGYDRTPPHDIQAEQSVLGGMLLSKDAITQVVEIIRSADFYRPAHQIIYDAVVDLFSRGEPVDAISVNAELTKRGEVTRVGGAPYLHTLTEAIPTAANAGYYAKIVSDRAILRRLVEVGTRIAQIGYTGDGEVDDLVDHAQAEIYRVAEKRTGEDYLALADIMPGALDEIEAIGAHDGSLTGVPTGFADFDALTNGLHPGQMVIIAARPAVGKSTLALDFARAASIKNDMTSVFFSLEMGRNEIVMRLLSAEARVPLHTMRSGLMTDDDWTRLARRMGEVANAPLFIDDSPNMSMMEIRAKARRLKQQHDLKLIVVDYLQLMSASGRVESRQQEVSEMSRSLKLLAKELEVPVVALSQLNRGPEQRTDKRPQVSDLRESGCLVPETRVRRADTGVETTLGELHESGETDIPVWSLDEKLRMVPRTMTHVFSSGTKQVYRLLLTSGREVTASGNHPFLAFDGWTPLEELGAGDRIAVPRSVPEPEQVRSWSEPEVILLAHLIGDGSFVRRQPIRYANTDEDNLAVVTEAAAHFGVRAVRDEHAAARTVSLRLPSPYRLTHGKRNPIAQWLDGLGLFGLRSHEKFVPCGVFSLPESQVALFLRHLWATDGSVGWDRAADKARIYYSTTSRRLVDDVSHLLMRLGIMSRIKETRKGDYRPSYTVDVNGVDDQRRFADLVGCHGARSVRVDECVTALAGRKANTNLDTVPHQVWDQVREGLANRGMTHREFASAMETSFSGRSMWKRAPSRTRLSRVAQVLDDADLDLLATNDVFWDEIAAVEPLGEREVFDATVPGTHNFVANGIHVHNSIEQDADMVILLYREDVHDKESPRAGEADIIVAKHRNGPTADVTVAFQGHYSRFVDMAPG